MPKINRPAAPTVRKTSLGSTAIELGDFRIILHDKRYSVSQLNSSWHRERYIQGRGWAITDAIPPDVQEALLSKAAPYLQNT